MEGPRDPEDDCPERGSDPDLGNKITHIADRLNQAFSYHFATELIGEHRCLDEREPMSDNEMMQRTVVNACLTATLVSLRDLDEFFDSRAGRPDDLRAHQFGYSEGARFLSETERRDICKLIVHSTDRTDRVDWEYSWDLIELLDKAVKQSIKFFDWICETHSLGDHFKLWTAAHVARTKNKAVFDWIRDRRIGSRED